MVRSGKFVFDSNTQLLSKLNLSVFVIYSSGCPPTFVANVMISRPLEGGNSFRTRYRVSIAETAVSQTSSKANSAITTCWIRTKIRQAASPRRALSTPPLKMLCRTKLRVPLGATPPLWGSFKKKRLVHVRTYIHGYSSSYIEQQVTMLSRATGRTHFFGSVEQMCTEVINVFLKF